MISSINLSTYKEDVNRFKDSMELSKYLHKRNIDGLEVYPVDVNNIPNTIKDSIINGVHLNIYPTWYDFWNGNIKELNDEFGDINTWENYYGGNDKNILIKKIQKELDYAESIKAKYVVFHVSECTLIESITYKFNRTDEEVCNSAIELINELLKDKNYSFYFLVENLWYSGFTFKKPHITRKLMDGILYNKKGIMLDTGHLLHTNIELKDENEGIDYILKTLKENGDLIKYILGIHLQQSISSSFVKEMLSKKIELMGDYYDKLSETYSYIYHIDGHNPFTTNRVMEIINIINPKFLTHEFISNNLEEFSKKLDAQIKALNNNLN